MKSEFHKQDLEVYKSDVYKADVYKAEVYKSESRELCEPSHSGHSIREGIQNDFLN